MNIENASVKVMRSYDYCHFEICLSSSAANAPEAVDELRKTAARLADKAVEQYIVAKTNREMAMQDQSELETLRWKRDKVMHKPESERTPEEKALVKAFEDLAFRNRPRYNYEDDWNEPEYDDWP